MELELLLVADSDEEAAHFERTLRRDSTRRYSVVRAGSIAEATRTLEDRRPDLAFVDSWLPDGLGIDLVERASDRGWTERSAFVLLTEGDDETLAAKALQAGVQDYVLKARLTTTALWQTIDFVQERKRIREELTAQRDELDRQNQELVRRQAELHALNERLLELASTDGLTGLKNHRAFQETLREVVADAGRQGEPLSIALLDVDHFKRLNDAHGHPAGDEVLVRLAEVLRAGTRPHDFLARYGGEEFALILPGADLEAAASIAERLRSALALEPFAIGPVTASFGCAQLLKAESASLLIARADGALYMAKADGRNAVRVGAPATLR